MVRSFLIMLNNLLQIHLKLLQKKKIIQKTAEANGDLNGNKIADAVAKSYGGRITKVSKKFTIK